MFVSGFGSPSTALEINMERSNIKLDVLALPEAHPWLHAEMIAPQCEPNQHYQTLDDEFPRDTDELGDNQHKIDHSETAKDCTMPPGEWRFVARRTGASWNHGMQLNEVVLLINACDAMTKFFSCGIAKCGDMCIRANASPPPALGSPMLLHEQAVPFVREYRYLGAIIDGKLSFKPWLEHKRRAVLNAMHALAPVLANRRFSVFAGMKTGLSRVQPAINKGVRMIFGVRPSTAVGPLLVESGVPLLSALSHVVTVRLLDRAVHKRMFVRLICSGDASRTTASTTQVGSAHGCSGMQSVDSRQSQ
ncbi:hypothetical protein HK105_208233 [Polyrhizophydium stewartii]|uniref:Uncharacterized protein n=1 Tax=Polyrhizophydium stewartii TaxID=2732419 RepID=A0ABR4MY99_9FUNG